MNEQFDNYSFLIKQAPASIYKDKLVFVVNGSTFGQGFTYPFKPAGFYYSNGTSWIYKGATATGGSGTVTSVDLSSNGTALTFTGNPITTAGTIAVDFNGLVTDYVDGTGALQVFPTAIVYTRLNDNDTINFYNYCGTAPIGTPTSGSWLIRRINWTTTTPVTQEATGAWTNRTSLIYT